MTWIYNRHLRRFWLLAARECVKRNQWRAAAEALWHSTQNEPPCRWRNDVKLFELGER